MSGCGLGDAGDNNSVGDENIRDWKKNLEPIFMVWKNLFYKKLDKI